MSSCIAFGMLVSLAAAAPAFAVDCAANHAPPPFVAHYEVTASRGLLALAGEATIEFRRDGNDYTVVSSLSAAGLLSSRQESRGTIGDGVLIPIRYSESNSRRAATSVSINWQKRRATFADGTEAPTPAALQDRASLMVQLASSLRARPDVAALEFPVASLRKIGTFKFVRRGTERIELPIGTIEAARFERVEGSDDDRLEVWLAPSRCALPVRIRLRDHRGNDIDQRLRDLRFE